VLSILRDSVTERLQIKPLLRSFAVRRVDIPPLYLYTILCVTALFAMNNG
jgi:hypothetical protein